MSKRDRTKRSAASTQTAPRRFLVAAAIGLALALTIIYAPALRAPFEFDDIGAIVANSSIRHLWPASSVLSPPVNTSVSGRPVVNVSLAINYALNAWLGVDQRPYPLGAAKTVSYHIVNLLAHFLCALLLFGIIRRTLRANRFADAWRDRADGMAIVVVAIWSLHPIQTEAIDYVIQRTELMVSVCYLATLYGSIRAWDAKSDRAALKWRVFSAMACLVGVWTKEVIVTAPVIVLLYDRAFRVATWRELSADRKRTVLYAVLAAMSVLVILLSATNARFNTVGFGLGITWYEYLYSQAWAIARYLRLFLWPDKLTFDYGQHAVTGVAGVPGAVLLTAFAVATLVAWARVERWGWFGFLGAWFFLILAPSSSVVPIVTEIAAERRIYLALAAVIVLIVVAVDQLRIYLRAHAERSTRVLVIAAVAVGVVYAIAAGWTAQLVAPNQLALALVVRMLIGLAAAGVFWFVVRGTSVRPFVVTLLVAFAATTMMRSVTYADPESLWRDTVRKAPTNPRALDNLAFNLFYADPPRLAEAKELYWRAISLDSTYIHAWPGLASIAVDEGKPEDAKWLLQRALAINPNYADAVDHLGQLLAKQGKFADAIPYLVRFANAFPSDSAYARLGIAYMSAGRLDSAATAFRSSLSYNPDRADAAIYLGGLLTEEAKGTEAIPLLEHVAAQGQAYGASLGLLSLAYAEAGRADDALQTARAALQRVDDPSVYLLLGRAMSALGRSPDALELFTRAVQAQPTNPESYARLGMTYAALGKHVQAADAFRHALSVDPTYAPAREALAELTGPTK